MAKHLEQSILNVGFGVLNPMKESITGKYFDRDNATGLDVVKKTTVDHFSPQLIDKAGQFVGIVLRVDGYTNEGFVNPNSFNATSVLQVHKQDRKSAPKLLQIRVRIPELHGHLPIPESLPDPKVASVEHHTINMYPCFVAKDAEVSRNAPQPGSLVWVDFQNRATFQGATYYGMVDKKTLPLVGKVQEDGTVLFEEGDVATGGGALSNVTTVEFNSEDTIVRLAPAVPIAPPGTSMTRGSMSKFKENRVKRFAYGNLKDDGPGPVALPGGKTGHPLLVPRLEGLNELWRRYATRNNLIGKKVAKGSKGGGTESITAELKIASGFRNVKKKYSYDNGGFRAYCRDMAKRYPKLTCRGAGNWIAFASAHETGLAVDFGNNGLAPVSKTISTQLKSPAFRFLINYGWLFGFYPYNSETWHFEVQVPRKAWQTGEEFAENSEYGELPPLKIVATKETATSGEEATSSSIEGPPPEEDPNSFSGPEYDWLAGEEFPYAIWVEETAKTSGLKTSDPFWGGIRTYPKGAETFRLPPSFSSGRDEEKEEEGA
tara:strand:- start:1477 stop:3111 length:1635 start_codon:yes stop_codon:yes gene_type:complete